MIDDNFKLKFKPNYGKRILATIIDYTIFIILFFIYVSYMGEENEKGGKTVTGLPVLVIPIFWFTYFVLIEAAYGATLAHKIVGLRVLTIRRTEIEFSNALKRRLLDFIDLFFYGIPALIVIKNSEKRQRIGDMWAETIVVDTKDPEQFDKIEQTN